MEKNIISLIGIVDTLIYLLETDKKAQKSKDASGSLKRLQQVRKELLAEGFRHSEILGSARDCISEVSTELQNFLSRQRSVQWMLHGVTTVGVQDVEPPPLPSSSSYGPKSISPAVLQMAQTLVDLASTRGERAVQALEINRLTRADGHKVKASSRRVPR